jgi:hypothetical protein
VNSFRTAQAQDITDSTSLNILDNIANPNSYSACVTALPSFGLDSWIPSISPNTSINPVSISCKVSGNSAGATACLGANAAHFGDKGGTCNGCMDSYILL